MGAPTSFNISNAKLGTTLNTARSADVARSSFLDSETLGMRRMRDWRVKNISLERQGWTFLYVQRTALSRKFELV